MARRSVGYMERMCLPHHSNLQGPRLELRGQAPPVAPLEAKAAAAARVLQEVGARPGGYACAPAGAPSQAHCSVVRRPSGGMGLLPPAASFSRLPLRVAALPRHHMQVRLLFQAPTPRPQLAHPSPGMPMPRRRTVADRAAQRLDVVVRDALRECQHGRHVLRDAHLRRAEAADCQRLPRHSPSDRTPRLPVPGFHPRQTSSCA